MRDTKNAKDAPAERQFMSLAAIARKWDVSRQTVRRVMDRHGKRAAYFTDGRNGIVRYRVSDVEDVELKVQASRAS